MAAQPPQSAVAAKLSGLMKPVDELEEGLLASAFYDGDLRLAVLKFYDPKQGRFWLWRDNTGHRPYCYTRLPMSELGAVKARNDVVAVEEEEKLDLLNDSRATLRKIVTTDPLAVGGGNDSIRDQIKAWEADIKYYENYAYDRGLQMGTYYRIADGRVVPSPHDVPERVARSLEELLARNKPEFAPYLKEWAELLGSPLCEFRRVAMDIEVANEAGRLPDPEDPRQPVIAVSFFGEKERLILLLRSGKPADGLEGKPYGVELFDTEADLLRAVMSKIMDYPVIVTFNGDNFDLRYLKHRADKLGLAEEENPIQLERVAASLKHGIHVDLYQFFRNRSIQVYAFGNRYTEHTLNAIADSLIGKTKVDFEGEIGDLPLQKLADYCLNDAQLTYELTSTGDSLVMKLLLVISRIGRMPVNDVSRLGVSNWIRSMLFFEHRRIGALIPRQDELAEKGGASSEAIIKGKKYKGGLVIEPKPGVFFDVSVLDFASLYPSLIKVHNLSYETVDCPHEECRTNLIPETSSWVCAKRAGIISLVTGSLRDLRVAHYKPLTRDASLSKADRELYNVVTQGLKVFLNACFTGDTYVMTPGGVRNIKELKVGDKVVNVNPESLRPEVDDIVEVQAFPYTGEMLHFDDSRFVDLTVTPNHRFLTVDAGKPGGEARFRTAEEVYSAANVRIPKLRGPVEDASEAKSVSLLPTAAGMGATAHLYPPRGTRLSTWLRTLPPDLRLKIRRQGRVCKRWNRTQNGAQSHYTVPALAATEGDVDAVGAAGGRVLLGEEAAAEVPARLDAVQFASLCGWFVSEGSLALSEPMVQTDGNSRDGTAIAVVSQSPGKGDVIGLPGRREVGALLSNLGLSASARAGDRKRYGVASSILHSWMREECYEDGARSHTPYQKRVPRFVMSSRSTIESFFRSARKGGGSGGDRSYSTVSEGLARDMALLLCYLGAKVKIEYDQGIYRVVYDNVSSKLTYSGPEIHKHVSRVAYSGTVYCVTTRKNHTVIAGRNGRFVHVGQSYGVLGFETFAFYCLPVAEATAALGRDAITRTIRKCEELGVNVLYSDTDSLFLQNPSREQVATVTGWADRELGVELDLDKSYRYVAFSSRKKNYFGVLPDGRVDIKGLTGKKSQTPEYLKSRFYKTLEILSSVTSPEDFERARAEIRKLLTAMVNDLKGRKVPVPDLAFNVMMGKPTGKYNGTTPQHVRAAMLLEEKGREIKAGEIIQYVKTKTPPYVKPAELARADEVDADKYIEYAHSMFDQLLDSLDFSFDEIMGATTLDFFWSG